MSEPAASIDSKIAARMLGASRVVSVLVALLGAGVLLGWFCDIAALKSIDRDFATMKVNTALSFLLLGLGLSAESWRRLSWLRRAAATVIVLLALTTSAEHALALDLGIDQLLNHDSASDGRMAPLTAAEFMLLGAALFLSELPRARWVTQLAALGVAFVSLFTFCGYVFGAKVLHRHAGYPIALHTGLGFMLGGFALFASRPGEGVNVLLVSDTAAGSLVRRLLPALVLLPMLLGLGSALLESHHFASTRLVIALQAVGNVGLLAAAVALAAASLHNSELRRRRVEHAARRDQLFLLELSELLRQDQTWDRLVHEVSSRFARFLDAARCSFVELLPDGQNVRVHQGFHDHLPPMTGVQALSRFSPAALECYREGRAFVVSDTAEDPRTRAEFEKTYGPHGMRALVSVPLNRAGQCAALLAVSSATPRAWTEPELRMIHLVAERTWLWVEQLRTLEALKVSEARKAAKLNSAFDGIVTMDHESNIIEFNPAAERLFGRKRSEVLGKHLPDLLIPEALREAHRKGLERYLATGDGPVLGKTVELNALRSDGTEFPAELAITHVKGQETPIFTAFIRDVSQRKRHEQERAELLGQLQAANAQLEERVAARTTELSRSLKEREVLLQEIHHRVKNNLQVISSLINMQMRQLPDGASKAALEECRTRVAAIALIHEKLYQSQDYARVPFSEYATSLASNIFHATGVSQNAISLAIDMQTTWLAVDRAIPCGLILNELITNALKHAFPGSRRGAVRVTLERKNGRVMLGVGDDGVGIPPGVEPARAGSLGMRLISVLVDQLDGKLEIHRGNGTAFCISFPDASN